MSKVVSNVKPPSLRTDEDLVQLVLELHYRSLTYGTKQQHDAASAAVTELKRRLGQRDAALKLADKWANRADKELGGEVHGEHEIRIDEDACCADELRAIFEEKP